MDTEIEDLIPAPDVPGAQSLSQSNIENLLADNAPTETPPQPSRVSSPAKNMLGSLFRKRKREPSQSEARHRRPISEILTDAFVAGHGFMEPAGGIPMPSSASEPGGSRPERAHGETMFEIVSRKVRRLIGWNAQEHGPEQQAVVSIDENTQMSNTTLVGNEECHSVATPAPPRNSPARSELHTPPPNGYQCSTQHQQQQQPPSDTTGESRNDTSTAPTGQTTDSTSVTVPTSRFSFRQRFRDSLGAMNKMLMRESNPLSFRFLSFPYAGHFGRRAATATSEDAGNTTVHTGYDGDNEGQEDVASDSLASGPDEPSMMSSMLVQAQSMGSEPAKTKTGRVSGERSNGADGGESKKDQTMTSGDEGDDEAPRKNSTSKK